jgi:acylphosphatase
MPELISLSVNVRGLVQGVFYRASTASWANELGICGWVKNEADGSVSLLLQHSEQRVLDEMLRQLAVGPEAARVDSVQVLPAMDAVSYADFRILH